MNGNNRVEVHKENFNDCYYIRWNGFCLPQQTKTKLYSSCRIKEGKALVQFTLTSLFSNFMHRMVKGKTLQNKDIKVLARLSSIEYTTVYNQRLSSSFITSLLGETHIVMSIVYAHNCSVYGSVVKGNYKKKKQVGTIGNQRYELNPGKKFLFSNSMDWIKIDVPIGCLRDKTLHSNSNRVFLGIQNFGVPLKPRLEY